MDDIGGILFYIIAAVIGIITTVGKKRRDALKKAPPDAETIDKEVFDESFDGEGKVEYQRIPAQDNETDFWFEPSESNITMNSGNEVSSDLLPEKELEGKYSEPMAAQFADEGKSMIAEPDKPEDEENEAYLRVKKIDEISKIVSEFDLKRAVIYSEILTRKDY